MPRFQPYLLPFVSFQEPLLVSQDNKVTSSLVDLHLIRTRHLKEKLDLVAEEVDQIRDDLQSLKNVDIEELEDRLRNLVSANEVHQMKVNFVSLINFSVRLVKLRYS